MALRPGGAVRLNPLDTGDVTGPDAARRRIGLTASLAVACLGRDLFPRERAAIDGALVAATARPGRRGQRRASPGGRRTARTDRRRLAALRTTRAELVEDGRDVALELRRLVHGDLRGMFDGPTTPGLRLDGPLVVLDLSAVYHSPALGVLMACAAAWLQSAVEASTGTGSCWWSTKPGPSSPTSASPGGCRPRGSCRGRWGWPTSRSSTGCPTLGRWARGSEQVGLAEGLLADSETRVVYAQSPGEVARAGEHLGLTVTEAELATTSTGGWPCGRWVGGRSLWSTGWPGASGGWWTPTGPWRATRRMRPRGCGERRRGMERVRFAPGRVYRPAGDAWRRAPWPPGRVRGAPSARRRGGRTAAFAPRASSVPIGTVRAAPGAAPPSAPGDRPRPLPDVGCHPLRGRPVGPSRVTCLARRRR